MMKLRNLLLASASVLFLSATANAGLLLDPYIGYGMGKGKLDTVAGSAYNTASDNTATVLGARVAFTIPMFFFGGDYMMVTGKSKAANANTTDSDVSGNALYLTAGLSVPLLRAYLGYAIMGGTTLKSGGSDFTLTGSSMKFGAGFTGLPFVAINLEWVRDTYTKFKSSSSDSSCEGSADMYILTVSLPLDF